MDSYFKSAQISLDIADKCYKESKLNEELSDRLIAKCCYELQQSLEYNIKGLILYFGNGIEFEYTHMLSKNINIIYSIKGNIDDFDFLDRIFKEIDVYIITIDSWAKESRYNYNFVTTMNSIENVYNIAKELNDYTKKLMEMSKK